MVSNKEKTLPSLPFFNKPSNKSNSNSNSKTKFSEKFPKTAEFFKKNKKPIIVCLIIFFIIILVIIIVAAVGGFSNDNSQDTGKPGINMGGKGDGTFYSK
jgi:ascorbate-specific PTS system EIIC-type component UlaA